MSNALLCLVAIALAVFLDALIVLVRQRARRGSVSLIVPRQLRFNLQRFAVRSWPRSTDTLLFSLALLVFLSTRLIGLERFPIYFFTDEAIGTVQAADFLDHGLRGSDGELLPTYFKNDQSYSISVSVYDQIIPYLLFGRSVYATRATSVLIAFTGAIAAALLLKNIFKLRFWWAAVLLLSMTPAWFLHSRTAFEHVLWVAFYAWFLYFYLQYRQGRPRRVFLALLAAALSFYSYNGGQLGVGVTAIVLLLLDARYHWQTAHQQPRLMAAALGWGVLLALPYLRFQTQHSSEIAAHLRLINSYWVQPLPLAEKASRFVTQYLNGLRPDYWYAPDNAYDLMRHRMSGYGHILWFTLPLTLVGLMSCLRHLRQPPQRTLLIALLIAPLGGALAALTIQRDLIFILPAALLATIGLDILLAPLTQRLSYRWLAGATFAMLTLVNAWMLRDALVNGPTWFTDYGLYGMQYGSQQVFQTVRQYLDAAPQAVITLFPQTWFNGPGALLQFFIPPDRPVQFQNFDDFFFKKQNLTAQELFVFDWTQYDQIVADPQFVQVEIVQTIPLPDGHPGFYFVRLTYSPRAEELLAAKRAARIQPITEQVTVGGETLKVTHTPFDIGAAAALFDGDLDTLARSAAINPATVDITFPAARPLRHVIVFPSLHNTQLKVSVYGDNRMLLKQVEQTVHDLPAGGSIEANWGDLTTPVREISLEIRDLDADEMGYVHLREITWQ